MSLKTIGIFAGMSWASSVEYYRIINRTVQERMGGSNSAKIVMNSVNFAEMIALRESGGWEAVGDRVVEIARGLKGAGADFFILAVNTVHIVADRVEAEVDLPLLHIADATAGAIKAAGMKKAGLLGTRYTMCEDFYRVRLKEKHGIDVVIPGGEDVERINSIILDELVMEKFLDESRDACLEMCDKLAADGAEGIILGCTELPLLMKPEDISVPSFDTMTIHAVAAAEKAME
jgi:aspartate racemase